MLSRSEALRLIGLDATHDAAAIEAALAARVTALEARRASAPTLALREKYARQLGELQEAQRVLLGQGQAAPEDLDLPVARPGEGGFVAPGLTAMHTPAADAAADLPVVRPDESGPSADEAAAKSHENDGKRPAFDDPSAERRARKRQAVARSAIGRVPIILGVIGAIVISAIGVVAAISVSNNAAERRQILAVDAEIDSDLQVLVSVYSALGEKKIIQVVKERAAWRDSSIFMLIRIPTGEVLAGNLSALPSESVSAGDQAFSFTYERPQLDQEGNEVSVTTRMARGKLLKIFERLEDQTEDKPRFFLFVGRDISP